MWKRKRCIPYSNIVQIMFPRKKQGSVLKNAFIDKADEAERGNRGASQKAGIGMVNCSIERKKRLTAMGSQTRGTTYHTVRVQT